VHLTNSNLLIDDPIIEADDHNIEAAEIFNAVSAEWLQRYKMTGTSGGSSKIRANFGTKYRAKDVVYSLTRQVMNYLHVAAQYS
jgi:hypothetical protein